MGSDNNNSKRPLLIFVVILAVIFFVFKMMGSSDPSHPGGSGTAASTSSSSGSSGSLSTGEERHISKNPMSVRDLDAGIVHTCAVDFSRKVYCWGGANKGSLGDDGKMRKCELEDGASGIACEYKNPNLETTRYSFTPVTVYKGEAPSESEYLSDATAVAVGDLFACAIIGQNNAVYCWGRGSSGQLGNGSRSDQERPVAVCAQGFTSGCAKHPLTDVKAISAGAEHVCAIVGDKRQAYCWGNGSNGRLGNAKSDYMLTPVAVCNEKAKDCDADPLVGVKSIVAGNYLTCAAMNDEQGRGLCWGDGSSNQLGNNNQDSNQSVPTPICAQNASDCTESPLTQVHQIAIGQSHTCAVAGDNRTAYCWGQARYGQIGNNNDIDNMRTPSAICRPGTDDREENWDCTNDPAKIVTHVQEIATGFVHTCAVFDSEHQAYCWGESFFGRLGDNGTHNQKVPVKVYNGYDKDGYAIEDEDNLWLVNVKSLSLGSNYSCAVLNDDTAKCWGNNQLGQLGDKERVNMLIPSVVGF